jgi:FkbM family methyltransferase
MTSLRNILNELGINSFAIVDVGAKGSISSLKDIESMSEVYAFEPNPDEFTLLKNKYSKHPFKKLQLNCLGLSEKIGKSSLLISKNNSMSSLLEPDLVNYKKHFGNYKSFNNWASNISTEKSIEIELETIDHYFENIQGIDFIKIDTQGTELSILKGSEKFLEKGFIKVLKIEVSTVPVYHQQALFSDIDIYLRKFNYCLVDFLTFRDNPSYLLGEDQGVHFAPCGDAIYCYVPASNDEKENIKKAVLINNLGYTSLALNILENTSLNASQKKNLIKNSLNRNENKWQKMAKDLLPPIVIKLLKKSMF